LEKSPGVFEKATKGFEEKTEVLEKTAVNFDRNFMF